MNSLELKMQKELEHDGWEVAHIGWPDFIAVRNGKVRLIELKSPHDKVSRVQERMHKLLRKAFGIKVEVIKTTIFTDRILANQLLAMLRRRKNTLSNLLITAKD